MSSRRHSVLPVIDRGGPRPPINFSSSLVISDNAILQGSHSITMQAETIVHPRSRFESSTGSILIGRRCIIHERAHVGAQPTNSTNLTPGGVILGDYVSVEVGTIIEAGGTVIGEGSVLQIGTKVGSGARIGKNCTITHFSVIASGEIVPDYTVIYSNGLRRVDKRKTPELWKLAMVKQIAVLGKMIPNNQEKFR